MREKESKPILYKCRKLFSWLGLYFILLCLPALTLWLSLYNIQERLLEDSRIEELETMAEITAHMLRIAEPETYYQESLRRLSEAFKWESSVYDVDRVSSKEKLELALFGSDGKRMSWPVDENVTMKRASESFLKSLKRLEKDSESATTPEEEKAAIGYGGSPMTIGLLAASPNTLINFKGIGLQKMGAWFKVQLPERDSKGQPKYGDLIAWLNLNELGKYDLAQKSVDSMERLVGSEYTFSYVDLSDRAKRSSSSNRIFKAEAAELIFTGSIKSSFVYKDELISISDTKEGIRLVCSKPSPKPLPIIKYYNRLFLVFLPALLLFLAWKKIFGVKLNLSVKKETAIIFGSAALIGILFMLICTIAYQYEKRTTIAQDYKKKAIDILEKIDQQYSDSFSELAIQYRRFIERIASGNEPPDRVLAPLLKAQAEDFIAYAIYVDFYGTNLFQAPAIVETGKSASIADRYSKIVNKVAVHCLKNFNSSRNKIVEDNFALSVQAVTSNAVEGLLADRSKFITVKLDSDEVIAFMDFTLDKDNFATGCLIVVHEPQKLENRYLNEMGKNIHKSKNFMLVAFPKRSAAQKSFYPRFAYINEEPLWKLNDMLNQTQLPSFKQGWVQGEKVIVAAITGNKMKNYNLFLSMPLTELKRAVFSLSNLLMVVTAFSLLFIVIASIFLINSIVSPVKILSSSALAIQEDRANQNAQVAFSDNSELESIVTGLTNLVVKVKSFEGIDEVLNRFFISENYKDDRWEISTFMTKVKGNKTSLCYQLQLEDNKVFVFLAKSHGENGLKASLPLVAYCMGMKVFVTQQGLRSSYACIKSLEEHLRINMRKQIEGSLLAMFIDVKNNILNYCGFGRIGLLEYTQNSGEYEVIDLPIESGFYSDAKELRSMEFQLSEGKSFIALTEPFSDDKIELLGRQLTKKNLLDAGIEELMSFVNASVADATTDCSVVCASFRPNSETSVEGKEVT